MVGDGSYLMMSQEIVTPIQEASQLTIVILDNEGFASIGGLSQSVGCEGFGTQICLAVRRPGSRTARAIQVDLAANAASSGRSSSRAVAARLKAALHRQRKSRATTVSSCRSTANRRRGYDRGGMCRSPRSRLWTSVQQARATYAPRSTAAPASSFLMLLSVGVERERTQPSLMIWVTIAAIVTTTSIVVFVARRNRRETVVLGQQVADARANEAARLASGSVGPFVIGVANGRLFSLLVAGSSMEGVDSLKRPRVSPPLPTKHELCFKRRPVRSDTLAGVPHRPSVPGSDSHTKTCILKWTDVG